MSKFKRSKLFQPNKIFQSQGGALLSLNLAGLSIALAKLPIWRIWPALISLQLSMFCSHRVGAITQKTMMRTNIRKYMPSMNVWTLRSKKNSISNHLDARLLCFMPTRHCDGTLHLKSKAFDNALKTECELYDSFLSSIRKILHQLWLHWNWSKNLTSNHQTKKGSVWISHRGGLWWNCQSWEARCTSPTSLPWIQHLKRSWRSWMWPWRSSSNPPFYENMFDDHIWCIYNPYIIYWYCVVVWSFHYFLCLMLLSFLIFLVLTFDISYISMTVDPCWSMLMSWWGGFDLRRFRLSTGKVPFSRSLGLQRLLCHVQQSMTGGPLLHQQKRCCFFDQIVQRMFSSCFLREFPSVLPTTPEFQLSLPWPRSVTPGIGAESERIKQ